MAIESSWQYRSTCSLTYHPASFETRYDEQTQRYCHHAMNQILYTNTMALYAKKTETCVIVLRYEHEKNEKNTADTLR